MKNKKGIVIIVIVAVIILAILVLVSRKKQYIEPVQDILDDQLGVNEGSETISNMTSIENNKKVDTQENEAIEKGKYSFMEKCSDGNYRIYYDMDDEFIPYSDDSQVSRRFMYEENETIMNVIWKFDLTSSYDDLFDREKDYFYEEYENINWSDKINSLENNGKEIRYVYGIAYDNSSNEYIININALVNVEEEHSMWLGINIWSEKDFNDAQIENILKKALNTNFVVEKIDS